VDQEIQRRGCEAAAAAARSRQDRRRRCLERENSEANEWRKLSESWERVEWSKSCQFVSEWNTASKAVFSSPISGRLKHCRYSV
jgi:hypothetical protein